MAMHTATVLEDALRRDVAILSTLAHLHCATVAQIHALCFPFHTLATARLTLHYLAEANFIARSTWRLKQDARGQVWVLTAKGSDLLQRYAPRVPPLARIDLSRPSTAVEHEEWRIRFQVRTLLTRFVLEARQHALLQAVEVLLPSCANWPTAWGQAFTPDPDAWLRVVWQPSERKAAAWLPWLDPALDLAHAIHYPIYLERTHARTNLLDLLPAWSQGQAPQPIVPLLILTQDACRELLMQQLPLLPQTPAVRLATWTALEGSLTRAFWMDETGAPCRLQPRHELEVA